MTYHKEPYIWLNGSNGLLGRYVREILRGYGTTICTTYPPFDITDEKRVKEFLGGTKFDIVIHCAGMTDVDWCESHEEEAWRVNAGSVKLIGEFLPKKSIFIYVSTDYVYGNYKNDDPLNTYGYSKFMGEIFTKKFMKNYYILRTSSLYGCGRPNFGTQLWASGRRLIHPVKVVNDMKCSPTYAYHVAQAILTMVQKKVPFGEYNFVDQGITTRAGFAKSLYGFMDVREPYPFQEIGLGGLSLSAKRPKDVLLDCSMSKDLGLLSSEDGITKFLSEMRDYVRGGIHGGSEGSVGDGRGDGEENPSDARVRAQ